MNKKLVAFGDVHLHWQAMRLILDYARMWHELRVYRDEKPERKLILTLGDKTAGVASDMVKHFVGVDATSGKVTGSVIYQNGNVLAAHNGQWIRDEYEELIDGYCGLEPLVIFHGHSHSMGVFPEYKWLKDNELVDWLKQGEEQHLLELGKVYWVNPGGQFMRTNDGIMAANFAIYDPSERLVTLKTILYNERDVHPSPTPSTK